MIVDDDDEMVLIPGPWAIVEPVHSSAHQFDFDEIDADTMPNTLVNSLSVSRRNREPSIVTRNRSSSGVTDSSKFIIRNEFGHARIQEYLARPEKRERSLSKDSTDSKGSPKKHSRMLEVSDEDVFETGGHVVLHPDVFQTCIEKGWGIRHPLAGHYHPITGTQIPETTMLFRAPCSDEDLDAVWSIVLSSYTWLTQA